MATGVVVDTNIFLHANDERVYCHQQCVNVLNHLINSEEDFINVDIDFNYTDEEKNRSPMGEEYWQHVPVSSPSLVHFKSRKIVSFI